MIKLSILSLVIWMVATLCFANNKERGSEAIRKKQYAAAIPLLKKHLRQFPKDYNAWNLLGSAYFFSGQPEKALPTLVKVEKNSAKLSYNLLFQGMCYEMLDQPIDAKRLYQKAASYSDFYAEKALIQLAVIEYHDHEFKRSQYWANDLIRRFPQGKMRKKAQMIIKSIAAGSYIDHLKGNEMPDKEMSLVKYHPLSLTSKFPNFWFLQFGYGYGTDQSVNPKYETQPLVDSTFERHSLNGSAAIGFGPYQAQNASGWFGYRYRQKWLADQSRLSTWSDDMASLEYFMFRADALQRHHALFAHLEKNYRYLSLGIKFEVEKSFAGSALIPGPEEQEIQKVLPLGSKTKIVPWFAINYTKDHRTIMYMLLYKDSHGDDSALSSQSYDISEDGTEGSYGLTQLANFPRVHTYLQFDLYSYTSIYNDFWLDKLRQGWSFKADHELISGVFIGMGVGNYTDDFKLPTIRFASCDYKESIAADGTGDAGFVLCDHVDTVNFYQLGLELRLGRFNSLGINLYDVVVQNPDLKFYESSSRDIVITYSTAFPGIAPLKKFLFFFDSVSPSERIFE